MSVCPDEAHDAVQIPAPMPSIPLAICGKCQADLVVRVSHDAHYDEYILVAACPKHGEIQGVAMRSTTSGASKPLIFSLIEGLTEAFTE